MPFSPKITVVSIGGLVGQNSTYEWLTTLNACPRMSLWASSVQASLSERESERTHRRHSLPPPPKKKKERKRKEEWGINIIGKHIAGSRI